jgi:hypothetical protein
LAVYFVQRAEILSSGNAVPGACAKIGVGCSSENFKREDSPFKFVPFGVVLEVYVLDRSDAEDEVGVFLSMFNTTVSR